jgi:hypothetical protein
MALEPVLLAAVKVTEKDAAAIKEWLGFWTVLVDPSPKFHCHEVGEPVDLSRN